jgi:hypothetical protein
LGFVTFERAYPVVVPLINDGITVHVESDTVVAGGGEVVCAHRWDIITNPNPRRAIVIGVPPSF